MLKKARKWLTANPYDERLAALERSVAELRRDLLASQMQAPAQMGMIGQAGTAKERPVIKLNKWRDFSAEIQQDLGA